jgi:hypothetical protein
MARTTKQTKTPATPGFAIEIKDDTELGLAILVAVYAGGGYRPVGRGQHQRGARDWGKPLAPLHRRRHREVRVVGAGSGRRLRPAGGPDQPLRNETGGRQGASTQGELL